MNYGGDTELLLMA